MDRVVCLMTFVLVAGWALGQAANPPVISRKLCACPNWRNSMAINLVQLPNGFMFLDLGLRCQMWDQLQDLAENAYSIHGGSLRVEPIS